MTTEKTSWWAPRVFKGKNVHIRAEENGELRVTRGMVDVRYSVTPGAKIYRGSQRNIDEQAIVPPILVADNGQASAPAKKKTKTVAKPGPVSDDTILIYTDGACSGNPGLAGSGIVVMWDGKRREHSHFLGEATNNIAELMAIKVALDDILTHFPERDARPIVLRSDSNYSIKVVTGEYKAKKNKELIGTIQRLLAKVPQLKFEWVKGHVGEVENERADELAREAITRRGHKTCGDSAELVVSQLNR